MTYKHALQSLINKIYAIEEPLVFLTSARAAGLLREAKKIKTRQEWTSRERKSQEGDTHTHSPLASLSRYQTVNSSKDKSMTLKLPTKTSFKTMSTPMSKCIPSPSRVSKSKQSVAEPRHSSESCCKLMSKKSTKATWKC